MQKISNAKAHKKTEHTHSTSIVKENISNLQLKDLSKQLLPNAGILQASLTRKIGFGFFQTIAQEFLNLKVYLKPAGGLSKGISAMLVRFFSSTAECLLPTHQLSPNTTFQVLFKVSGISSKNNCP